MAIKLDGDGIDYVLPDSETSLDDVNASAREFLRDEQTSNQKQTLLVIQEDKIYSKETIVRYIAALFVLIVGILSISHVLYITYFEQVTEGIGAVINPQDSKSNNELFKNM